MITEYAKRLRQAMHHAGLNQKGLISKTGLSQSTVSSAMNKLNGSTDTAAYAVACGVNADWLATGKGQMLSSSATVNIPAPSPSIPASVSRSNQAVSSVDTAQSDTNSIAVALAVIQKHTQRTGILDPPCRDLVNALLEDCIKRPELAAYLDTVIERMFEVYSQKHHTPDHARTGTTG